MLSLDPEGDPYRICLVLDQLALRGGQAEHLLQLSRSPFYADDLWRSRPNIDVSSALAEFKLKQVQKCRASLAKCVVEYPWLFPRLFQELNIDHIPKSVWGKSAATERDKFECELYVHNAKDLWNTPEAISFLVEVVESAEVASTREKARRDTKLPSHGPITLDEARHVFLSGVPSLINLIPREYTSMPTSSSDPLPPPDDVPSYDPSSSEVPQRDAYQTPFEAAGGFDTPPEEEGAPNRPSPEDDPRQVGEAQELQGFQGFFRRFMPWIGYGGVAEQMDTDTDGINARVGEIGNPAELFAEEAWRAMNLMAGPAGRPNEPEAESTGTRPATVDSESESEHHDGQDNANANTTAPNNNNDGIPPTTTPEEEPYDDDRNKRWLAGQGMLQLRDFCTRHGTDENAWNGNSNSENVVEEEGRSIVSEYARRVLRLRETRSRRFILDYSLSQGAGREVKELVEREMGRVRAGTDG